MVKNLLAGGAAVLGLFVFGAAPVLAQSTPIDIFLIAGQSNAVGYATDDGGAPTSGPVVPAGKVLKYSNGIISDANDPVGGGTGSAWPAFGIAYYNLTGRRVGFVPTAVGSTGQTAAADTGAGNWSPTGTLYQHSITTLNAAMAAFAQQGYVPTFKGILWAQGETDAFAIDEGLETQGDYGAALSAMIARYHADLGTSTSLYLFRLGANGVQADPGWAAVRDAQMHVAAGVAFCNAVDFPYRSLEGHIQGAMNLHYMQAGYNEMGTLGAQHIVAREFGCAPFYADEVTIATSSYTILHAYDPLATSCTIRGGAYGSVGQNIQLPAWAGWTGVITTATTYTLDCQYPSGKTERAVTVYVGSDASQLCSGTACVDTSRTTLVDDAGNCNGYAFRLRTGAGMYLGVTEPSPCSTINFTQTDPTLFVKNVLARAQATGDWQVLSTTTGAYALTSKAGDCNGMTFNVSDSFLGTSYGIGPYAIQDPCASVDFSGLVTAANNVMSYILSQGQNVRLFSAQP